MANVLPFKTRCDIAAHLVDGTSINATSRLVKVTKKAILRFLLLLGEGCARLHDRLVRNVHASDIEADEIWSFVHKKQHRCGPNDPSEWGDNYTFVGMVRASKLVVSYLTGPRDGTSAFHFAYDLKKRLVTTPGRVQFSTDGFQPYIPAFRAAFGLRIDYGQVVKQYSQKQKDDHRYEPPRDTDFIRKTVILGCPSFSRMSTSGVERQNLTMRMSIRRLTRLTNAFSKKRRNLGAAIALHFMYYNFCRIHESLRSTPAMASGVEGDRAHLWEIEELVERALAEPEPPPAPLARRVARAGAARALPRPPRLPPQAPPAERRRHRQRERQRRGRPDGPASAPRGMDRGGGRRGGPGDGAGSRALGRGGPHARGGVFWKWSLIRVG